MHIQSGIIRLAIITVAASALLAGTQGRAQAKPARAQAPATAAAPVAPATEKDAVEIQKQLIQLLRQSPTLAMVVARDPSLLSNQEYVEKNNPQLAAFISAHPEVARNPEYYLFNHLNGEGREPSEAIERVTWPEMYRLRSDNGGLHEFVSNLAPLLALGGFLWAAVWGIRLVVENRRWNRIFKLQSEVHGRLIDKFSTSQELAAYMETDAGRRFLEAAPIPLRATSAEQPMPNAIARVLTPVQIGVVMVLLGVGFLFLRHADPDMDIPMLVAGTIMLMPGIGFIISAGITWILASRLGLMPPKPEGPYTPPANRFDAPLSPTDRQ